MIIKIIYEMLKFNRFIVLFVVLILQEKILTSNRLRRNVNIFKEIFNAQEKSKDYPEIVKNVKDLFICGTTICEIVDEFSISSNNTFNCFEKYVGINLNLKSNNQSFYGFLGSGYRAKVLENQVYSKKCSYLKR